MGQAQGNSKTDSSPETSHDEVQRYSRLDEPDSVSAGTASAADRMEDRTQSTQSSLVTIFAIWNTMLGSSILAMPWAVSQAGLVGGICSIIVMGILCCYTAYLTYDSVRTAEQESTKELQFGDVCEKLLGRWAGWLERTASFLPLLGATIVFWVLMTTFLKSLATFAYERIDGVLHQDQTGGLMGNVSSNSSSVVSAGGGSDHNRVVELLLNSNLFWSIVLAVPLFPIANLRNPSFFAKLSSLGSITVCYLAFFVFFKCYGWGINFSLHPDSVHYSPLVAPSLPSLTGVLCSSYFIHNCITSLLRNNRVQSNNSRDLCVGYGLAGTTYLVLGVPFYLCFPLNKTSIKDNLLVNFASDDLLAIISRAFLLLQLAVLYPMVCFIAKTQVLHNLGDRVNRSARWPTFLINSIILAIVISFAVFYPQIGNVLRYCGAVSGLLCAFFLPSAVRLRFLQKSAKLGVVSGFVHVAIIVAAVANFVLQFVSLS